MQGNSKVSYRYTLTFPKAETYAVDDILNIMSEAQYQYSHPKLIENTSFISCKWGKVIDELDQVTDKTHRNEQPISQGASPELENCENSNKGINLSANTQREQEFYIRNELNGNKAYLMERLLEAVVEKKFQLWDSYSEKVVAPPINITNSSTKVLANSLKTLSAKTYRHYLSETYSPSGNINPEFYSLLVAAKHGKAPHSNQRPTYKTDYWWAKMTSIYKDGLIEFCEGENIRAVFEGESVPVASQNDFAFQKCNADLIDAISPPCISKDMVTISILAIKAAWEIETKIDQRASATQVIDRLKEWAESKKHPDLIKAIPKGVMWMTTLTDEKKYDIDACRKTLTAWHKRRLDGAKGNQGN